MNRERLAAYNRLRALRNWFERPFDTLGRKSLVALALAVPLGLVWIMLRTMIPADPAILGVADAVNRRVVKVAIGSFVVISAFHELRKRRIRAIERSMLDFLGHPASINETGLTVIQSLRRVSTSDLGLLGDEVERAVRDIDWGTDAQTALRRMGRRTASPMVSRSVTLIVNAMSASGDLAFALHIVADEAQDSHRLTRERNQEMPTYLLVIYTSFPAFLGIIAALTVSFTPVVEQAGAGGVGSGGAVGVSSDAFSGLRDADTESYMLLFLHVTAVQGLCSGVIAGQLGEGQIADSIRHVAVLLVIICVASPSVRAHATHQGSDPQPTPVTRVIFAPPPRPTDMDGDEPRDEAREAYDRIMSRLASTREYPWPEVESFVVDATESGLTACALDLGCDDGRYVDLLSEHADGATGLDVSHGLLDEAAARAAERGFDVGFAQGDASQLPFTDDAFDLTVYVVMVHHLTPWTARVASLNEFACVLDADSHAVVSVWSIAHDTFDREDGLDTTIDQTLPGDKTVPRFCHIYASDEFDGSLDASDLAMVGSTAPSGNCYAVVAGC